MIDRIIELFRQVLERIPKHVRQSAISFLGMTALVSPLFLWMTWSPLSFRIVLYGGVSAVLLIYLLIWSSPDEEL
jgi:uncharacterized membrane protein